MPGRGTDVATISDRRIEALRRMAEDAERVEFTRALEDGRIRTGMATPEDVLGLIDTIAELRAEVAVYEQFVDDVGPFEDEPRLRVV